MNKIKKLLTLLKEDGVEYIAYKTKKKMQSKFAEAKPLYSDAELAYLKYDDVGGAICFSVLVPLYNTPERLLREMIKSVIEQIYPNWELCLADGSDEAHGYVGDVVREYTAADQRIKYCKLSENKGISGNTNACIEMSTGDYIALFDHDDLLHPAALYEVFNAIYSEGADFIYTDETMFYESPEDAYSPHYKPDFALDTLRSYNYITHLSVFSRTLMDKVGLFRSEFDGSQDYDMILRLTEQAEKIVHIPKILYYWRNHPGSVASDVSVKPYTMVSARKALAEHLERVGLKGVVEDSSVPTTYRIRYEIQGTPLVSIVFDEHPLCECVEAIRKITSYPNYEIVTDGQVNGEYVLFLSDFVRPTTPDWIEQLLMFAQREDVGAVGAMIRYDDGTVCSAGKILGIKAAAGDSHPRFPRGHDGYKFRLTLAQNYSAVSSKCMMIRRDVWEQYGAFDASMGPFADVDFCLHLREEGYVIVWTPYAEMTAREDAKGKVSKQMINRFREKWGMLEDPYYNPNFTMLRGSFEEK